MDGYLSLKALHVGAAVTWIGGMLSASLAIAAQQSATPRLRPTNSPALPAVAGRWDRRVTTPAMLFVWAAGITMALQGHWFAAPWLMIKLALVVLLSAVHGVLSGTLRALERHPDRPPSAAARYAAPATVVCVFVITILAIAKPF